MLSRHLFNVGGACYRMLEPTPPDPLSVPAPALAAIDLLRHRNGHCARRTAKSVSLQRWRRAACRGPEHRCDHCSYDGVPHDFPLATPTRSRHTRPKSDRRSSTQRVISTLLVPFWAMRARSHRDANDVAKLSPDVANIAGEHHRCVMRLELARRAMVANH